MYRWIDLVAHRRKVDPQRAEVGPDGGGGTEIAHAARREQEKRVEEGEDVGARLVNRAEDRTSHVGKAAEGADLARGSF